MEIASVLRRRIKIKDKTQPGYNVIESQYLKNYIVPEQKMGFIQFLRNVHRKKVNERSEYVITGLDRILFDSENVKEISGVIRNELAEARRWIPRGLVLFLPVEGEFRGEEDKPLLHFDNRNIDLRLLFGNRIERKSVARCFASFDIEK